jgi:hypothetical protein
MRLAVVTERVLPSTDSQCCCCCCLLCVQRVVVQQCTVEAVPSQLGFCLQLGGLGLVGSRRNTSKAVGTAHNVSCAVLWCNASSGGISEANRKLGD